MDRAKFISDWIPDLQEEFSRPRALIPVLPSPHTMKRSASQAHDAQAQRDPDFARFEQHTSGFGSKMLAKMGFAGRLGKNESGPLNPLPMVGQQSRHGLDYQPEKKAKKRKQDLYADQVSIKPPQARPNSSSSSTAPSSSAPSKLPSPPPLRVDHRPPPPRIVLSSSPLPIPTPLKLDKTSSQSPHAPHTSSSPPALLSSSSCSLSSSSSSSSPPSLSSSSLLPSEPSAAHAVCLIVHYAAVCPCVCEVLFAAWEQVLHRHLGRPFTPSPARSLLIDIACSTDRDAVRLLYGIATSSSPSQQPQQQDPNTHGYDDEDPEAVRLPSGHVISSEQLFDLASEKDQLYMDMTMSRMHTLPHTHTHSGAQAQTVSARAQSEWFARLVPQLQKQKWKVCVVHPGARERCNFDLQQMGVRGVVSTVVSGTSLSRTHRPYGDLWHECMDRMQVRAEQCVSVVACASDACDSQGEGVRVVLVRGEEEEEGKRGGEGEEGGEKKEKGEEGETSGDQKEQGEKKAEDAKPGEISQRSNASGSVLPFPHWLTDRRALPDLLRRIADEAKAS